MMEPARACLQEFANLRPDWDSYGAEPISDIALRHAGLLLSDIEEVGTFASEGVLRPFAVAPLPSGGVQIEWRGVQAEIEVAVDAGGAFSYLIERPHEAERFVEVDNATHEEVVAAITQVLFPTAGAGIGA
jgi:hypothetical protein